MKRLHVNSGGLHLFLAAEDANCALQQLTLPLCDLVGMNVKLLR